MKRWYLLYCKRGQHARAKQHLNHQGLEYYAPEITIETLSRGKRQWVNTPLFPGYVFVKFDYEVGPSFTTVRSTRGVVDFVRFGRHPKEVHDRLIIELQSMMTHHQDQLKHDSWPRKGASVHITKGPFAGIDAIFQEADGETRSILLIHLIQQPVPLSIDNRDLDFKTP